MRLLLKELKKLFNPRLLIILALFSAFLLTCLQAAFLHMGQDGYYISLYKELIPEFGAELSLDEWDAFLAKRDAVAAEFAKELAEADSEILNEYGIKTYEDYRREQARILDKYTLSEEEFGEDEEDAKLLREMYRVIDSSAADKLDFQLQHMDYDYIMEKEEWHVILSSESEFEAAFEEGPGRFAFDNEAVLAREKELVTRGRVSLLHGFIPYTVEFDFGVLLALAAIICFVLVLPRMINERLRMMRPMQAVTKTGRGIFAVQARACALLGLASGVFVSLYYGILLCVQGVFIFLPCDLNGVMGDTFWVDMSFGSYLLIHAGVLILFSICCGLAAYFIGRLTRSYIAGIGLALPAAAALVFGFSRLSRFMLTTYGYQPLSASFLKFCGMLAIFAAIALAVLIMLKRDKVRDIL